MKRGILVLTVCLASLGGCLLVALLVWLCWRRSSRIDLLKESAPRFGKWGGPPSPPPDAEALDPAMRATTFVKSSGGARPKSIKWADGACAWDEKREIQFNTVNFPEGTSSEPNSSLLQIFAHKPWSCHNHSSCKNYRGGSFPFGEGRRVILHNRSLAWVMVYQALRRWSWWSTVYVFCFLDGREGAFIPKNNFLQHLI